jgi:hypothetical protein
LNVYDISGTAEHSCAFARGTWMGAAGSVRAPGPVFGVFRGPGLGVLPRRPNDVTLAHRLMLSSVLDGRVMLEGRFEHAPPAQSAINRNRPEMDRYMDQKPASDSSSRHGYFDGVETLTDRRCPVSGRTGCIADR